MKKTERNDAADKPKGPLGTFIAMVLAVVLAVGVVALWAIPFFHMTDDLLLHFTGTKAATSSCEVSVLGQGKARDESLDVSYTTVEGAEFSFEEDINFNNWARDPDRSTACEVRYSPSSPWRYSTSWGFDRLLSRFLVFLVVKGWALALTVFALCGVVVALKEKWSGRADPTQPPRASS